MKIVLALSSLAIGGTESYVLTVAEHLDRLAHDVFIYSPEPGLGVEVADERGLAVVDASRLPDDCDVALVQDAAVSFELAELRPEARQVFVAHSESFDPQAPPQLADLVDVAIALNDRVARRLRSFASELEVVRLRQPIDTERFLARSALPEIPRQALILSNNQIADRQAVVERACAEAGLELTMRGGGSGQTKDPRPAFAAADVVIGYGRAILEAMACGRAAYVYDWSGGEGWVTPESYPSIESDGFAGRDESVLDAERLVRDLRSYSRSMGPVNRDLVVAHHRANVHAQQLLELFERIAAPSSRPAAPLSEMARLVRLEWRARSEVHGLLGETASLRREVGQLGTKVEELEALYSQTLRDAEHAARQAREEIAATADSYARTLSWRLTRPLRAIGDLLRRLARR